MSQALRQDLETLIEFPVVIRTDFKSLGDDANVLSQRTDTCTDLAALEGFLTETSAQIISKGCRPGDLAFLVHRFIPGRSAAWSYSTPGSSRVVIDATWGLPDGLNFHPHDSFDVDLDTQRVRKHLRCKTDYVDVDENGVWNSRAAGRYWDWKPAISDAEALEIARMSTMLADGLNERVDTMFFISGGQGGVKILPWFFTRGTRVLDEIRSASGYYLGEKIRIETWDDLRNVKSRVEASGNPRTTLELRPATDLLRSKEFILDVAKVANELHLPVELAGSQLAHAYYILEDAGVGVRCVDPWKQPERRRSFGKLVRDLVPVRIARHGELAMVYPAHRAELVPLVKAKIIEEAFEYFWEGDGAAVIEELADLLELLQTAARLQDIDFASLQAIAAKKRAERGGFLEGRVLIETSSESQLGRVRDGQNLSPRQNDAARTRRFRQGLQRRPVRLPNRRVVLPLAPASRWQLNTTYTIALDADEELAFTYTTDGLHVQVRERDRSPLPGQQSLPGV